MSTTVLSELRHRSDVATPALANDSDAALLDRVRAGDSGAYAELYRRHEPAARRLARQLVRSRAAADDLVSDSFAAVLAALHNGAGPTEAFRPYLLTTLRRRHWRAARDREEPADPTDGTLDGAVLDPDGTDGRLMAQAYSRLPERWQLVLWHTEIEGAPPADVAPLVGLSPHATAALAHRAREGLREAYLQAHLQSDTPARCAFTVERLGALVRDNLGRRDRAKADAHLETCPRCRTLRSEMSDLNRSLRSVVAPLVLGAAAAAYLGRRATADAPATAAIVESLRGSAQRAAVIATSVALAVALLLLQTDATPPVPDSTRDAASTTAGPATAGEPTTAAGGPRGGTAAAAAPVALTLPGDVRVQTVADRRCDDAVGVALTGATSGATEGAGGSVVRAVLFRGDIAGIPALDPSSLVTTVRGATATTLRSLVTTTGAGVTRGAGGAGDVGTTGDSPSGGASCVSVPTASLLAGDGPWRLLVGYLPSAATSVDDLVFVVVDEPFTLLGDVVHTTLRTARATLAATLSSGATAAGALGTDLSGLGSAAVAGAAGTVNGLLDGATSGVPGSGGSGGTGGTTGTGGTGGTGSTGGTGGSGGTGTPIDVPPVTVPPVTVPTLPPVTVPPLPPLPPLPQPPPLPLGAP